MTDDLDALATSQDPAVEPDEIVAEASDPALDAMLEPVVDGVAEPVIDAVPVLAEARTLELPYTSLPAVQAAAVAATSFVAGAATLALVKRHSAKKVAKSRATRRAVDMLPIVGSRTFLVDVHLLAKPGE